MDKSVAKLPVHRFDGRDLLMSGNRHTISDQNAAMNRSDRSLVSALPNLICIIFTTSCIRMVAKSDKISNATNDCNVFRRQIKSSINEGWLVF
jgi:hypothetical protein